MEISSMIYPWICTANFLANTSDTNKAAMGRTTAMTHNLKAAISPLGDWVIEYKAEGNVWRSPLILDTKTIVAPNSPRHLAKARIVPVMIRVTQDKSLRHYKAPITKMPRMLCRY